MSKCETTNNSFRIGVIGGGIAGSTVALRFAELGHNVTFFEAGPSLVNGPPICHLHAGGSLYREISDLQCQTLLKQSIDVMRLFPHTINVRPTVITVPTRDPGSPHDLLPRLVKLRKYYSKLVQKDPKNALMGRPEEYFKVYHQEDMEELKMLEDPEDPKTLNDWMIPVAKSVKPGSIKYPVYMVQEYGWSILRMAATLMLALETLPSCQVKLNCKVSNVECCEEKEWKVTYKTGQSEISESATVEYLVNACGYQTGGIDDLVGVSTNRLVEFKAAYIAKWKTESHWPEVVFHGTRGTSDGMGQLTPYPDGVFQLHGMTKDITLFQDGLAQSSPASSQPQLAKEFQHKLTTGWQSDEVTLRTEKAIDHIAHFIPSFCTGVEGGKPLFGAQQIPGNDSSLRTADVSFPGDRYARVEIVKGSSAPLVADIILEHCIKNYLVPSGSRPHAVFSEGNHHVLTSLTLDEVRVKAEELACHRNLPTALAKPIGVVRQSSMSNQEVEISCNPSEAVNVDIVQTIRNEQTMETRIC